MVQRVHYRYPAVKADGYDARIGQRAFADR